jgi:hypothetical protein
VSHQPAAAQLRASYDRVADEYVRRIYDELRHKPFDREWLDRFAAWPAMGFAAPSVAAPVKWRAICTNKARRFAALTCRMKWWPAPAN